MQSIEMAQNAIEENTFAYGNQNGQSQDQLEIERLWKTQWITDYAQDIFENLMEAEMRRLPIFFPSTQPIERPNLLQLCQYVAHTYKLNRTSVHLGIYYMDRMTDYYSIRSEKLPLLALTCLHIAAQIENTDASVPRYSELNRLFPDSLYTVFEYNVVERKVLSYLNFELIRPTTATFAEFFACSFLTRTDYANYRAMLENIPDGENVIYECYESFDAMLSSLSQLLLRLSDCTLSIKSFANARPSLLAATCIGAVRHLSGLKFWTQYLTNLTSYQEHVVEPLLNVLVQYYQWQQETAVDVCIVPVYADMGQSSADNINPNWSTPDSGIGESIVIVEELVTLQYDVVTVQQEEPAVLVQDLTGVAHGEPQEQTAVSHGEQQEQAFFSQGEPQEQVFFFQGEPQVQAFFSQGEPQEQAFFSQGEPQEQIFFSLGVLREAAAISQGEPQEQAAFSQGEPQEQTAFSQGEPQEQAAFSQGEPQEQAAFSPGEPQKQAAFSQGEPQEQAAFSPGEPQKQAAFSQGEPKEQAAFSQGEPQKEAAFSQGESQKQPALKQQESALESIENQQKLISVAMKKLKHTLKRKRQDCDYQEEPQSKRRT